MKKTLILVTVVAFAVPAFAGMATAPRDGANQPLRAGEAVSAPFELAPPEVAGSEVRPRVREKLERFGTLEVYRVGSLMAMRVPDESATTGRKPMGVVAMPLIDEGRIADRARRLLEGKRKAPVVMDAGAAARPATDHLSQPSAEELAAEYLRRAFEGAGSVYRQGKWTRVPEVEELYRVESDKLILEIKGGE